MPPQPLRPRGNGPNLKALGLSCSEKKQPIPPLQDSSTASKTYSLDVWVLSHENQGPSAIEVVKTLERCRFGDRKLVPLQTRTGDGFADYELTVEKRKQRTDLGSLYIRGNQIIANPSARNCLLAVLRYLEYSADFFPNCAIQDSELKGTANPLPTERLAASNRGVRITPIYQQEKKS